MEVLMRQIIESNDNLDLETSTILSQVDNKEGYHDDTFGRYVVTQPSEIAPIAAASAAATTPGTEVRVQQRHHEQDYLESDAGVLGTQ